MKQTLRQLLTLLVMVLPVALATQVAAKQEVVMLIDNSRSMKKSDSQSLTKEAVAQFLQNVPPSTRVAFLIFDKDIKTIAHLTPIDENNRFDLLSHVDRIDFRGALSQSGVALAQAIEELSNYGEIGGEKYIIFFTDGIVHTGDQRRDLQVAEHMRGVLANEAADKGIRIFTIAFTENADKQLMEHLATTTGGTFLQVFQPMKPEDLGAVFAQINAPFVAQHELPSTAEIQPAGLKTLTPEPAASLTPAATAAGSQFHWVAVVTVSVVGLALLLSSLSILLTYRISRAPSGEPSLRRDAQDPAQAVPGPAPKAILYQGVDLSGRTGGDVHDITGKTILIGRDPGEGGITIPNAGISRRHAVIEYRDYTYWLIDQASTNGTFINGKRITGMHRLNHGDCLHFHTLRFLFLMPGHEGADKTQIVLLEGVGEQAA